MAFSVIWSPFLRASRYSARPGPTPANQQTRRFSIEELQSTSESREIAWKRVTVEAAAIVASILLAFAIDAWWDDHNGVERERRLLQALLVEFEQNSELLRESRQEYELYYMDAQRMLEYLHDGPDVVDAAAFEKAFRGLLLSGSIQRR